MAGDGDRAVKRRRRDDQMCPGDGGMPVPRAAGRGAAADRTVQPSDRVAEVVAVQSVPTHFYNLVDMDDDTSSGLSRLLEQDPPPPSDPGAAATEVLQEALERPANLRARIAERGERDAVCSCNLPHPKWRKSVLCATSTCGRPHAPFLAGIDLKLWSFNLVATQIQREGGTMSLVQTTTEAEAASKVSLASLYAADLAAAVGASFVVAPFITVVDRAIIQNASGAMKLGESVRAGTLELVTKPHRFLRRPEFVMVWGVYASTYMCANAVVTTCERRHVDDSWPKFLGTTATNLSTCISKDRAFTRMFGTSAPKSVPVPTYLLFTIRDAMTIGASFNLPGPVSVYLQEKHGMSKGSADVTAQLACPAGVQLVCTPLHLIGLDLYNHPNSTLAERGKFMADFAGPSIFMRICRIGPAFGVGGVGNTSLRQFFRSIAGC